MLALDRCILHVDDDEDDRFLIEQAWAAAGIRHPLRSAPDGQTALDHLRGAGAFADRARHPLPALLLVDLKMPGITGFDLLTLVRKDDELSCLPMIVLTASTAPSDVARAYRLGANGFFVKPSTADDLTAMLSGLDGCWLKFNEFPSAWR